MFGWANLRSLCFSSKSFLFYYLLVRNIAPSSRACIFSDQCRTSSNIASPADKTLLEIDLLRSAQFVKYKISKVSVDIRPKSFMPIGYLLSFSIIDTYRLSAIVCSSHKQTLPAELQIISSALQLYFFSTGMQLTSFHYKRRNALKSHLFQWSHKCGELVAWAANWQHISPAELCRVKSRQQAYAAACRFDAMGDLAAYHKMVTACRPKRTVYDPAANISQLLVELS